jgi:hypothetical protein
MNELFARIALFLIVHISPLFLNSSTSVLSDAPAGIAHQKRQACGQLIGGAEIDRIQVSLFSFREI